MGMSALLNLVVSETLCDVTLYHFHFPLSVVGAARHASDQFPPLHLAGNVFIADQTIGTGCVLPLGDEGTGILFAEVMVILY
jgi:hypothetical protein